MAKGEAGGGPHQPTRLRPSLPQQTRATAWAGASLSGPRRVGTGLRRWESRSLGGKRRSWGQKQQQQPFLAIGEEQAEASGSVFRRWGPAPLLSSPPLPPPRGPLDAEPRARPAAGGGKEGLWWHGADGGPSASGEPPAGLVPVRAHPAGRRRALGLHPPRRPGARRAPRCLQGERPRRLGPSSLGRAAPGRLLRSDSDSWVGPCCARRVDAAAFCAWSSSAGHEPPLRTSRLPFGWGGGSCCMVVASDRKGGRLAAACRQREAGKALVAGERGAALCMPS